MMDFLGKSYYFERTIRGNCGAFHTEHYLLYSGFITVLYMVVMVNYSL